MKRFTKHQKISFRALRAVGLSRHQAAMQARGFKAVRYGVWKNYATDMVVTKTGRGRMTVRRSDLVQR